jgi:sialic acid synthase SpsE
MREEFHVPVGYSDHTLGNEISFAAVAMGACIIEKHFTLNRTLPGPDHAASLEPDELMEVVRGIRKIESAMGDGRKIPAPSEGGTAAVARKSLVAARAICAGETVTPDLLAARRPGTGLPPGALKDLLGRRVGTDIAAGTLVTREMFT